MANVVLKIHVAWWVKPYCGALIVLSLITGRRPDMAAVERRLLKGVTVKVKS